MNEENQSDPGQERFGQFLQALDRLSTNVETLTKSVDVQSKALRNLLAASEKQIEIVNRYIDESAALSDEAHNLFAVLNHKDSGLLACIDDLIAELGAARTDLQKGLPVIRGAISAFLGGRR